MKAVFEHAWDISIAGAREIQNRLRERVQLTPLEHIPETVAAVDVSYTRWDRMGYAVLGVFQIQYDNRKNPVALQDLLIETVSGAVAFPYIPGYLSFREIPMLLPLFERIDLDFDVMLVDGVGIAHPRRLGLAAHLGLLFDKPSIGCAKSRLVGDYREPGMNKGASSPLYIENREVGTVLRSRRNCRPLFVSPGHKCTVADAARLVLSLCFNYRLAEPIRRVDQMSKQLRKTIQKVGEHDEEVVS
ncbi:MAG: endonuclease V [Fidelibacterota bacterium]